MFDEVQAQIGLAAQAADAAAQPAPQFLQRVGREVRGRAACQARPQVFDRVQFQRIRRQAFHRQPRAVRRHLRLGRAAAVGRQSVPQQHNLAPEMTAQLPQESPHLFAGNRAGLHRQEQSSPRRLHLSMPASSRSRACRAGFWQLQPIARRILKT